MKRCYENPCEDCNGILVLAAIDFYENAKEGDEFTLRYLNEREERIIANYKIRIFDSFENNGREKSYSFGYHTVEDGGKETCFVVRQNGPLLNKVCQCLLLKDKK